MNDIRDRRELFLAAVARGDASDLPDPETREEAIIAAIARRSLPPYPTEDGQYVLTLEISGEDASLAWVSA